jgi:hypothetical protein
VVSGKPQDTIENEDSFEWMNDLDEIEDDSYFQGLTQVFKKNIKFMILTPSKLVEKAFYYENYGYSVLKGDSALKSELTIFFDKNSKTSFILYPQDKPTEEELDASFNQRTKAKANTAANIYAKPPLNGESLKSLKSFGADQVNANGSLSTLDTINTQTSLNELENKDRTRTGPANRPHVLKKAGTLNVVTTSLNDFGSPSFSYPESAQIRPSTEKVYYMGFHSASKDVSQYRLKTEEDGLMRKDREPTPSRPSTTYRAMESPALHDRTFSEVSNRLDFSRTAMNSLPDDYRDATETPERSLFLDKSPIKEGYNIRAYMSETKDRNEQFYNRGTPMESYSQRGSHIKGAYYEPVLPAIKAMALPILLKSKFDRFNHTVNQHDQEIANTVARHMKNDGRSAERTPGKGLGNIMNTYQMIVNQAQENRRISFGTILRMDI